MELAERAEPMDHNPDDTTETVGRHSTTNKNKNNHDQHHHDDSYIIMPERMPTQQRIVSPSQRCNRNYQSDDENGYDSGDENEQEEPDTRHSSISPSPSLVSVLTADGIHDYTGFVCVCLVILIGDMSRGVMFPSLWPLVQRLGGTEVFQGYTVAAFSLGRVMTNPIFGSLSHTYGYTNSLLTSSTVLLLGTLLYAQNPAMDSLHFLVLSQIVLGMGSGTLGVTRAFVADVTAKRNRTTYMAWSAAVQYTGFTVFPVVGAIFNKVYGDNSYSILFGLVQFNMFTAPAHFMMVIVIATIAILVIYFADRERNNTVKGKSQKRLAIDERANTIVLSCCPAITGFQLSVYDCCIIGCMLLNLATKGSIASFETLGIAIAQEHFGLESSRAGGIIAACGSLGVICLLNMDRLERRFADVYIIMGGILVMGMGIAGLILLPQRTGGDDNDTKNPAWRFALAMFFIYSVGYPIGHTALVGLFSKIIGRRPQGTLLGWFASTGSLARMIFPIVSGYVAQYGSIQTLCGGLTTILLVSAVFVMSSREILTLLSS